MISILRTWIRPFIKAMRLLSLTLALGATTMGILAAYRDGSMGHPVTLRSILLIFLVTVAGLASQLGANLINDYFEGFFKYVDPSSRRIRFLGRDRTVFDVFVFAAGLASLALAGLIGLYLVWLTDWVMLLIGLVGLLGSYAYTGEPFVYKTRGLGVVLSFILMGPLMLLGAYYPFAASLAWSPVIIGLPVSLLVPALMVSNEMRDFHRDERLAMGTMSTRLGRRGSLILWDTLTFGAFGLVVAYAVLGLYPTWSLVSLVMLPAAIRAHLCVSRHENLGIPWTNRVHLGLFLILAAVLTLA